MPLPSIPAAPFVTPSSLAIASFDHPWPWHTLSATRPRQRASAFDVFQALAEHPMHRLAGVAFDDDPSLATVTRNLNEGADNHGVGRAFALVLDNVRITLIEDANDGCRSAFEEVELEWQGPVRNRFVPVDVLLTWTPYQSPDPQEPTVRAGAIALCCPYTQAVILSAGTSWNDEHYPIMINTFHPEAMVETARRAEVRELHAAVDSAGLPVRSRARL